MLFCLSALFVLHAVGSVEERGRGGTCLVRLLELNCGGACLVWVSNGRTMELYGGCKKIEKAGPVQLAWPGARRVLFPGAVGCAFRQELPQVHCRSAAEGPSGMIPNEP